MLWLPLLHYSNLTFVLYSFFSNLIFVCLFLSFSLIPCTLVSRLNSSKKKIIIEQESNGEETNEKQFFRVGMCSILTRMLSLTLKIYFVIQFSSHNRTGERTNEQKKTFSRFEWEKTSDDDLARATTTKRGIMSNQKRQYEKKNANFVLKSNMTKSTEFDMGKNWSSLNGILSRNENKSRKKWKWNGLVLFFCLHL